jgi:YHS domain-containing protein
MLGVPLLITREGEIVAMAYTHTNSKGVTYYLNSKTVTLRGGKQQTIYYFSKDERAETAAELPEGFTVNENPRNGFLTVKRK